MKTIIFIAITIFAATDSYDLENIDVNVLLNNTEEFKKFVDCVLDRGECSKLYSTHKAIIVEAMKQACEKCSAYHKYSFWMLLQAAKDKFPSDYDNFRHKYDPENKYFDALESELKKYSTGY